MGNALGDHRHRGRVMQDSQAWRSERKITAADRRGLNTKAYNNEVACPMVREIVRAAIAMGGRRESTVRVVSESTVRVVRESTL